MAESAIPGATHGDEATSAQSGHTQVGSSAISFHGGDHGSLHITAHKLNGKNYLQWAQSVKIVICGRGKLGYITGELPTPTASNPAYKTWLADNSIILTWLINSWSKRSVDAIFFSKLPRTFGTLPVECILTLAMLHKYLNSVQN